MMRMIPFCGRPTVAGVVASILFGMFATRTAHSANHWTSANYNTHEILVSGIKLYDIYLALWNYSWYPADSLSILYSEYIDDPKLFWHLNDDQPAPTDITNDLPDALNSTQISFNYMPKPGRLDAPPYVLLMDNSITYNSGVGASVLVNGASWEFYAPLDTPVTFTAVARSNLKQIGLALVAFANDHEGALPDKLSELYPVYVSNASVFYNPGDDLPGDPSAPTVITNDLPDAANSAEISYAYHGTGRTLLAISPGIVLVHDNSPSNNGGVLINVLTADMNVASYVPATNDCSYPESCRAQARVDLRNIVGQLIDYAYENDYEFPQTLSSLYRNGVYDPRIFHHPGDEAPFPLRITSDEPNGEESVHISYHYIMGRDPDSKPLSVILLDNSLSNNDGLGILATTLYDTVFLQPTTQTLPSIDTARNNVQTLGSALLAYAEDHGGQFPDQLSTLYPDYISSPTGFYNPGDTDPAPFTINNDEIDGVDSALVSYHYFGSGVTLSDEANFILLADNSLSNNAGSGIIALTRDGRAEFYATIPSESPYPMGYRYTVLRNLRRVSTALYSYAYHNNDVLPTKLSMLYPDYLPMPVMLYHPNDDDPWPITIDNDDVDQSNSALISFDYLTPGRNINQLDDREIVLRGREPWYNGGYSINVLYGGFFADYVIVNCNDPYADVDNDGDVDQTDFATVQRCWDIQGYLLLDPICQCIDRPAFPNDLHGDAIVDPFDIDAFFDCVSGPAIPAEPACDD